MVKLALAPDFRALVSTVALSLSAATALAEDPPPIDIHDWNPEESVMSQEEGRKDPVRMSNLVMELLHQAEISEKKQDWPRAARYYRAVAKASPDRATGYGRACLSYRQAGVLDKALEMCRLAVTKDGSTFGYADAMVRLLLAQPQFGDAEAKEAADVLEHVEPQVQSDAELRLTITDLRCQLATRREDLAGLRTCVSAMESTAPSDPRTFVYGTMLAVGQEDWSHADKLVADAQARGLPAEALAVARAQISAARESAGPVPRWLRSAWLPMAAGLAALLMVLGTRMLRRREPRSAH